MKNLITKMKTWFALRKADMELNKAARLAWDMYRIHNKRYYVIPDTHHQLRVFSWAELKQMKKQGLFSAKCKEPDFIRESFYFTPSRIQETELTFEVKLQKRKMWHTYYKAYRI